MRLPLSEPGVPGLSEETLDSLMGGLRGPGWYVLENWPPTEVAGRLRQEALSLDSRDRFRPAGIGHDTTYRHRPDIRGDRIYWLDPKEPEFTPPATMEFLELLDSLRIELARRLYLGLRSLECHFAIYPPGIGYRKHLDRFTDSAARELSFVVYLNEDRHESDGGLLRLFSEVAPGIVETEIVPRMGTSAFFLSGSLWHEVTPTTRERCSLTGWFRSDGFIAPRQREIP